MKLSLIKQRKGKENALFSLHLRFNTQWFLIWDFLIVFYLHFCYHPLKAWSSILDLLPLCQCSLYSRDSKTLWCSRQWSLFFGIMTSFCLFLLSSCWPIKSQKFPSPTAWCPSFLLIDLSTSVLKNCTILFQVHSSFSIKICLKRSIWYSFFIVDLTCYEWSWQKAEKLRSSIGQLRF